jgi:hypothetical protein
MLSGTADLDQLAGWLPAPTIPTWGTDPFEVRDLLVFQLIAEVRRSTRQVLLPPGLHPTDPPALSIQAWRVGDSSCGSFNLCFMRLSCRSGVRARGFTTAAYIDNPAAASVLRGQFGFPCKPAELRLDSYYDGCDLTVGVGDRCILAVSGLDPDPLGGEDVQYTATLNLAHTPNGLRLVQVESHHHADRVERVAGRIVSFDADAWGDGRLDPYYIVTTTLAHDGSTTLPPVRFVCRAEVNAFDGTEAITK